MPDSFDARCVQLEREYRLLSENALETVLVYDIATAKFIYASPSTVNLRGFTAEETIRQAPGEFMPPESLQKVSETARLLYARFSDGERRAELLTSTGDFEIYCRDGTSKYAEVCLRLAPDKETGAVHIIGVSRDITKRKLLEEQLNREFESKNEVIRRLSESEQMLKDLTGELDRKNKILNVLAARDSLTGLCNRYRFDQKMSEESDRCRRYRSPLSVVFFDIDHFKRINDTFGHLTGDHVLIKIADAVGGLLRRQDVFARWGGEEFVVLMPQTDLSAAAQAAERIRKKIENLRHDEPGAAVTASLGVTEFMHGETAESFFVRADYALYQAKSAGRNRVTAIRWENAIPMAQVRLEWKDEWACGNDVIDGQHKELVSLGNQLLAAAFRDCSSEDTARALETLIAHIVTHFDSEERILRESGYPEVGRHAEIHRQLVRRAKRFRTQFHKGRLKSTAVFSFLLDEVIVGHLLTEDILFFHWLKEHG
jgi:diguanylate cyclase (GGDEF)-like protein/hemerythrin-like metal-binding protein/PAS domain S-box-containing protein